MAPESKAGAKERAGFIEAPEINDKKNMSKPTMPPMAIPPRSSVLWYKQLKELLPSMKLMLKSRLQRLQQ